MPTDIEQALALLEQAAAAKKLSPGAVEHLRTWIREPRYSEYRPLVLEHLRSGQWGVLDDVFWTVIPFGTGGRRGKMYPIGSNAINDRTIGESAQGLADYVAEFHRRQGRGELSCAIGYDTRRRSRHFAELCAEVMVASGFRVYFLDGFRSTPELSLTVRHYGCSCGIMVTASHNPPSDNAVKCYWSTGGQLLPPHDEGVIQRVMQVDAVRRSPFKAALAEGRIRYVQDAVDRAYHEAVLSQGFSGPRDLSILYSPLHGVGAAAVAPVLAGAGFKQLEIFAPHAEPNGDFPNVPKHVANPEEPAVFEAMIEYAQRSGAELIIASDPDADRLGAATPLTPGGAWRTLTGNQLGALLADYLLEQRQTAGTLTPRHFIAKTLVTTELTRRIAEGYGVRCVGNLHVGFKWIAGAIDAEGPEHFLYGTEESYGYMAGSYVRDKDAAVAALLTCELAARCQARGQTLHQQLDALFLRHGCHAELTVSKRMPGSQGMENMRAMMRSLRESPPHRLAGLGVRQVRDYLSRTIRSSDGSRSPLDAPAADMVIVDLEADGAYAAVRPSGTEPKVKFYLFAYAPPRETAADLAGTKRKLAERLQAMRDDWIAYAER